MAGLTRRELLAAGLAGTLVAATAERARADDEEVERPVFVATWPHGVPAVERAAAVLASGRSVVDAVEDGVGVCELDPDVTSVGLGGWPNAAGVVQLDASIMVGRTRRCGAVGALEGVVRAISVARRVMDRTPHTMLVGAGARAFAEAEGFETTDLLTERARAAWERWKAGPGGGDDDGGHDTIGLVGLDGDGRLAGACTTSGLAWKLPGRVGDSPIVGAGLYVDDAVGAASATGVGEEVVRICGSMLVVERMRSGDSPQEAVEVALRRIDETAGRRHQVAFVALDRKGRVGAASLQPGFRYAVLRGRRSELVEAKIL